MTPLTVSAKLRQNYADYYTDADSEWRRISAMGKADNVVTLCKDLPRTLVLEIGAGEGALLRRLAELNFGAQFYAVEISPSGVEAIKRKQIPRLLECKLFDGYQLPYEDGRFDIAILSHVVEHLEHPRQLLYEAARVASYVFVEVPLEDTVRLSGDFVFDRVGHINFYSPKTIRLLVQSCNLRVLGQIAVNPPKEAFAFRSPTRGWISYYIKQMLIESLPGLATKIFTYHGALVCEKQKE